MHKPLLSLIFPFLFLFCLTGTGYPDESVPVFYYFNPDASQVNFNRLTAVMEAYFAESGFPLSFQPFARQSDLDEAILRKPPAFLLSPSWYVKKKPLPGLRPYLSCRRDGTAGYRKVLLAKKESPTVLADLKNSPLATTSMGADTATLIEETFRPQFDAGAEGINIVTVPKDSDALFALVLDQVKFALVVKDNMESLTRMNPRLGTMVRPLLETRDIPLPVLCHLESTPTGQLERMKSILSDREKHKTNPFIDLLNIDDWQNYSP